MTYLYVHAYIRTVEALLLICVLLKICCMYSVIADM